MGLIPSRNPWQQRTISLQGDLACVHCTYNLRGLAISGTCPECGQRIWDSFLAGGVSALKQATQIAAGLCFLTAFLPPFVAGAIAICCGTKVDVIAPIVVVILAIVAMVLPPIGWCRMPVIEFRPAGKRRLALLGVMAGSACMTIASAVLSLTLPAGNDSWITAAWLGTASLLGTELVLLAGTASRPLFLLNHPVAARMLHVAQTLGVLATFALMARAVLTLWDGTDGSVPIAAISTVAASSAMMAAMFTAAICFQPND